MFRILTKYHLDVLFITLLLLTFPLFFYKLGNVSLTSFDEAWYADIARNIITSGDLFNLRWNDKPYYDHPPAGFWFIAIGEKIFGINEFGARSISSFFGLAGVVFLYLLGRELYSKYAAFLSAVALSSAYWYLFRARSGNLDVFLTALFIICFYLAFKAAKNKYFLIPLSISLSLLLLTKSIVPLTIIPSLIIIFWGRKLKLSFVINSFFLFLLLPAIWFISHYFLYEKFIERYFGIGLPGYGKQTDYLANFLLIKEYLHSGVGKWFWPGVLGIILSFLTFKRGFLAIAVFCISFFTPFMLSEKGHIWHLVPLFPFMILLFFASVFYWGDFLIKRAGKKFSKFYPKVLLYIFLTIFCFYFSQMQIKRMWYEFIDVPAFVSDEAILSTEAGKHSEEFFIDGDFTPAAIFYSNKKVNQVRNEALESLFEKRSFVLITKESRLDQYKIDSSKYRILKSDRDKILIIKDGEQTTKI